MNARKPTIHAPVQSAFTLIELLVVLLIIAILAGILYPVVGAVSRAGGTQAASNTVAIAVETARYLVTQQAQASKPALDTGALITPMIPWSGTAALFTASGQIRFVQCNQNATSSTLLGSRTLIGGNGGPNYLGVGNTTNASDLYHGYSDVPGRDYMTLPSAEGIVGIIRTNSGLHLITPPFAVRFNKAGVLVSGDPDRSDGAGYDPASLIIYDGNYDGNYGNTSVSGAARPGGYIMPSKDALWDSAGGINKYRTAFEQIESVVGVVLFDPSSLTYVNGLTPATLLDGDSATGYLSSKAQTAIMAGGKVLLFNRYTGVPIRKLSHD